MAQDESMEAGGIVAGLFLFFFGLPFTLVPVLLIPVAVTQIDDLFPSIFMMVFSVPFLLAGLGVQFAGVKMIRDTLVPTAPEQSDNQTIQTRDYTVGLDIETESMTPVSEEKDETEKANFWDSV